MPVSANSNPDLTPGAEIVAFREHYKLNQAQLDRLFGFISRGRTTRRWEAQGAPRYVKVLLEYGYAHGLHLMEKLAREID